MSWDTVRDTMNGQIVASQIVDAAIYHSRQGPKAIGVILAREFVDDLDMNITETIADARTCDIDEQPQGQRIDVESITYTIREARELTEQWYALVLDRADI